jgi:hypothetical protein
MKTTETIAIKKTGSRYYYFSFRAGRAMPIKASEAELMISTESAVLVEKFFYEN